MRTLHDALFHRKEAATISQGTVGLRLLMLSRAVLFSLQWCTNALLLRWLRRVCPSQAFSAQLQSWILRIIFLMPAA